MIFPLYTVTPVEMRLVQGGSVNHVFRMRLVQEGNVLYKHK